MDGQLEYNTDIIYTSDIPMLLLFKMVFDSQEYIY